MPGRPKGHPKSGGRKAGTPNGMTIYKHSQLVKSIEITVERIRAEYASLAFMPAEECIERQIPVREKVHSLDSLGKHLGMFIDRAEITGKDGAALNININGINIPEAEQ